MTVEDKIHFHIEKMWGGLEMASIQYFIETGRVSGSFFLRLKALIEDCSKHPVQSSSEGELKICTGCNHLSTDKIEAPYLACCPDNNYLTPFEYAMYRIREDKNKDLLTQNR